MATRGNNRPAAVAATIAVVLWQLTTELRVAFGRLDQDLPLRELWPPGSPFSLQAVFASGGRLLDLLGMVMGLAVLFVVVLVLVRAVVHRRVPARGTVFLASWMAVVVGVFVAGAVMQPIMLAVRQFPGHLWAQMLTQVTWTPYWGVVVGWLAALAAALSARPTAVSPPGGDREMFGYPGSPGYPAASGSGAPTHPEPSGGADLSRSPYLSDPPDQQR